MKFNIDNPSGNEIERIAQFSGWSFDANGEPPNSVIISINNTQYVELAHCRRDDVGLAFPDTPRASLSGFIGDLVIPDSIRNDDGLQIAVTANFGSGQVQLLNRLFKLTDTDLSFTPRHRTYELASLLRHPVTGQRVDLSGLQNNSLADWPAGKLVAGTIHFHPKGSLPVVRITETGSTHPYSEKARKLIDGSELFLDFGTGIRPSDALFEHGVLLDAIHFRNIDVANTFSRLPFKDNVFDLVVSQAVFEHLPEPFFTAQEIWRVLKPGGRVLVDTAFMQPLHADPCHYFNMTQHGLKQILSGYEIEEIGIQPYQYPSLGMIMQLEAVLPFIQPGKWEGRLQELLVELKRTGAELDVALGPIGQETLAAGVFALARKS